MSTKRIIEDKDFHRIVIATRRGARNITMRVKPDGLYLTDWHVTNPSALFETTDEIIVKIRYRKQANRCTSVSCNRNVSAD